MATDEGRAGARAAAPGGAAPAAAVAAATTRPASADRCLRVALRIRAPRWRFYEALAHRPTSESPITSCLVRARTLDYLISGMNSQVRAGLGLVWGHRGGSG